MARILRTALYAVLLVGFLVYLFYVIDSSPGVLERRTSAELARYFATSPEVKGGSQAWMGALSFQRIAIPPSPAIESPHLLLLEGIEVESASDDWSGLGLLRRRRPSGSLEIRIAHAALTLDFQTSAEAGEDGSWRPIWNFGNVLRDGSDLAEAAGAGHRVTMERLDLRVQGFRPKKEKVTWSAAIEDVQVTGGSEGQLTLEGDLIPGPYWSAGQVLVRFNPGREAPAAVILRGTLDDLRGLDEWLGVLFPAQRRLQKLLSPQGAVELTLDDYPLFSREAAGSAGGGKAVARHYDATLRLPLWNIEVRHASGALVFDRESVALGAGKEQPLIGEIWGSEVEIRGAIGQKSVRIDLHLPTADLQVAFPGAASRVLASLWARLRPSGSLEGDLGMLGGPSEVESWSGSFSFKDLASEDLLFLGPFTGKLTIEAREGGGQGVLGISSGRMEPFGRLVGEVPFQWTDQELTLKPALTPRSGSLAGKISCSAGGSLSGGVTWERAEIDFAGGLLSAGRSGGKVELKSETPGVLAEVTAGLEEVSLRVDRLPRGDLSLGDGEKLSFEKGSIVATLTAEGLNPLTLVLKGEGCGLRLLGNVGRRGDLDAIMVVAVGEEARAINALPFPSPPSRWRAAVEDRALPLRLRGDSRACQARRVEWSDPSFRS